MPPLLIEAAVGIIVPALMILLRMPFQPLAGDRAPYAFTFIAVVVAAVLGGWRSGLIAIVVGQLLAWYFIVTPTWSFDLPNPQVQWGLFIATISQVVMLTVIALYQHEVAKGAYERERRLDQLDHALREIDHRTTNNYQTVLALIHLQLQRSTDEKLKAALGQVADRIQAIADASRQLAVRSADLGLVRLDDHLCGLVQNIERGLSRDGIDLKCDVEEAAATPEKATSISIIVNELVTNAIKHAFNGEASGHVWVTGKAGKRFELIVADDGRGIEASRSAGRSGLGTKLVESFARQIGAQHEVTSSERGTTHRLVIPELD